MTIHAFLVVLVALAARASTLDATNSCDTPDQSCAAVVQEKQVAALLQISSGVSAAKHHDITAPAKKALAKHDDRMAGQAKKAVRASKRSKTLEPYMWHMIRSDPWNCSMFPAWDARASTCSLGPDAESLDPEMLQCGGGDKPDIAGCGVEQANAYRTLSYIGALPCCRTAPFCAAPVCAQTDPLVAWQHQSAPPSKQTTDPILIHDGVLNLFAEDRSVHNSNRGSLNEGQQQPSFVIPDAASLAAATLDAHPKQTDPLQTCTKRSPEDNVAYMKLQEAWPAYHGLGGAFELDTLKYVDLLACHGQPGCPEKTFDLMIDLGANTGYFSEKVSVRRFAKDYIMIEANPGTTMVLRQRWGDANWMQTWFRKQVGQKDSEQVPEVEIINQALSNHSNGTLDLCQTEGSMHGNCLVNIANVDKLLPASLTPKFQEKLAQAQSAFIKIDTEGMDELVLRGMRRLLEKTRGTHEDGSPRHLVNFLQFEYSPALMKKAQTRENFEQYDLKTTTQFLESIGFETFMIGPRFLPLSHGSWHDQYKNSTEDPKNNAGKLVNYPQFDSRLCPWCTAMTEPSFTTDIFAMRSSHPHAAKMKLALGACQESKDFEIHDPQYEPHSTVFLSRD